MEDRDAQGAIEMAAAKLRAARQEFENVPGKEPLSTGVSQHRAWSEAAAELNRAIASQNARLKADNDQMRLRLAEIYADTVLGLR